MTVTTVDGPDLVIEPVPLIAGIPRTSHVALILRGVEILVGIFFHSRQLPVFETELPKNNYGKVFKKTLRRRLSSL